MYIISATSIDSYFSCKEKFTKLSHNGHLKDSNPKPSVVGTYAHSLLPQLCLHLRAIITQSSVLIKLEYATIYCNKTFKTRATAQNLLQHLYDMLWLVNKTGNAHIT